MYFDFEYLAITLKFLTFLNQKNFGIKGLLALYKVALHLNKVTFFPLSMYQFLDFSSFAVKCLTLTLVTYSLATLVNIYLSLFNLAWKNIRLSAFALI